MAVFYKDDDPWLRLAIGIVDRAVEDYRLALFHEKFEYTPTKNAEALEHWFRSEWGQLVCLGQGEYIIHKVKEEVKRGRFYRP